MPLQVFIVSAEVEVEEELHSVLPPHTLAATLGKKVKKGKMKKIQCWSENEIKVNNIMFQELL